jgi:membrane associated rhomboid family serine protease
MIPLRDDIPTETFPFVTILLIAGNCAVFFLQLSLDPEASAAMVASLGVIPSAITGAMADPVSSMIAPEFTLATSMFLHGGVFHLGGNMVFLWIFGNNIEDATGHFRFLLFYLLAGLAAAGAHIWLHPDSRIPMIGASGAVSGVLGAYFLLYPRARIMTLVIFGFFIQTVMLPAAVFLGFWFLLQAFSAWSSINGTKGGVAWFAHLGGFLFGMPLVLAMKRKNVRMWSGHTGRRG